MDEILLKTEKGIALDKKELKLLLQMLGLRQSKLKKLSIVLNIVVVLFLLTLSFGFFFIPLNIFLLLFTLFYMVGICFVYILYPYYKKVIDYFCALDYLIKDKFANYYGYEVFRAINIPDRTSYLQKNTVLVLTNEYEFVIYDDFLISSEIELKTYKPTKNFYGVLKLVDGQEVVDREPLIFKMKDIVKFELITPKDTNYQPSDDIYQFINHTSAFRNIDYRHYVVIELNDLTTIKIGHNIVDYLRKYAPLKEIKENEEIADE